MCGIGDHDHGRGRSHDHDHGRGHDLDGRREVITATPRAAEGDAVDRTTEFATGVPAQCTGRRARQRLAAALPDAFVPDAVCTTFTIAA